MAIEGTAGYTPDSQTVRAENVTLDSIHSLVQSVFTSGEGQIADRVSRREIKMPVESIADKDWLSLETVFNAQSAREKMPDGKQGVVLGSGDNSANWEARGWITLDIDPDAGAIVQGDANQLEKSFQPGSLDYLYAENLTFDPTAERGVHQARLLQQANRVLKLGGIFSVYTVHFSSDLRSDMQNQGFEVTLPDKPQFEAQLNKHGFAVTTVAFPAHRHDVDPTDPLPDQTEERIVYIAKKVADGFSDARTEVAPQPPIE